LRASGAIRGDGGDNLLFVEADLEEFILDSTDVRVHQHGAGARKKKRSPDCRALLRWADDESSRGLKDLVAVSETGSPH